MVVPVKWNFSLFVDGGQSLALSDKIDADAYDKISITIKNGVVDQSVEVQPGDVNKVDFLCIKSDQYHIDANQKLVYKVGNSAAEIALERAHVLIGNSLIALFGEAPKTLKFSNSTGKDVNIDIHIVRKAMS